MPQAGRTESVVVITRAKRLAWLLARPQPLERIREALDVASRCLRIEEPGDDPSLLDLVRDLASAAHDQLEQRQPASPLERATALQILGVATLRLYETGGALPLLLGRVRHLRGARALMPDQVGRLDDIDRELAIALTRLGEQTSDLAPLREAVDLLDRTNAFGADDYRAANARAVAMMRVGSIASDSAMVERAARDLQAFRKTHALNATEADMTDRNVCSLLLENARQTKSERVYRSLGRVLAGRVPPEIVSDADRHYAQLLGSTLLELAQLNGEISLAERAVEVLGRLITACADRPRARIEALHSLGQAHFRTGKAKRDAASLREAIRALETALGLCENDPALRDGRSLRLHADLGAYTLALAWTSREEPLLAAARDHYELSRTGISQHRAPGLFAQVSLGLFELEYQERNWARAAAVAEDIDGAFERIEADPRLTAGIHDQVARQRSGLADKQARCLLFLGRDRDAGIVLERARGRRLALAMQRWRPPAANLETGPRAKLAEAERRLRAALAGEDEQSCRLAWEALADARRCAGLDLGGRAEAAHHLATAAPEGGAFVQLSFSQFGSVALLWLHGAEQPRRVDLSKTAFAAIARLFRGEGDALGWLDSYERYVTAAERNLEFDEAEARWNGTIEDALAVLGGEVFEPLDRALRDSGLEAGAAVHISPPGDLALLPSGAARLADGRRLADNWSVSVMPNAALLATAPATGPDVICVADPAAPGEGLSGLPMATREVRLLGTRLADMRLIAGEDATPTATLAALANAGLLHAACHGIYDSADPGQSGLELARGARLTLTRIAAAGIGRLPLRLVFLSCCEAGMTGRTMDYDEFVGLPGAFLQLGATGVIAALWAVSDGAAMAFALRFYDLYLGNDRVGAMEPAAALAQAQAWLRTVTAAELVEEGYFEPAEAARLSAATGSTRLRRVSSETDKGGEDRRDEPAPRSDYLTQRPFAAPTHWAAWVLTGR